MKLWRRPKLPSYGAEMLASVAHAALPPSLGGWDTQRATLHDGQGAWVDEVEHRMRILVPVATPPKPGGPLYLVVDQHMMPRACDVTFEVRTGDASGAPLASRRITVPDGAASLLAKFDGDELESAGVTASDYEAGLVVDLAFHSGWSKGKMAWTRGSGTPVLDRRENDV